MHDRSNWCMRHIARKFPLATGVGIYSVQCQSDVQLRAHLCDAYLRPISRSMRMKCSRFAEWSMWLKKAAGRWKWCTIAVTPTTRPIAIIIISYSDTAKLLSFAPRNSCRQHVYTKIAITPISVKWNAWRAQCKAAAFTAYTMQRARAMLCQKC